MVVLLKNGRDFGVALKGSVITGVSRKDKGCELRDMPPSSGISRNNTVPNKRVAHPKLNILSSLTHPHVLYDLLSVENKRRYFEVCLHVSFCP